LAARVRGCRAEHCASTSDGRRGAGGPGLSAGAELGADAAAGGPAEGADAPAALAEEAFASVTAEYLALEAAIADPAKRTGAYQQPWLAR